MFFSLFFFFLIFLNFYIDFPIKSNYFHKALTTLPIPSLSERVIRPAQTIMAAPPTKILLVAILFKNY